MIQISFLITRIVLMIIRLIITLDDDDDDDETCFQDFYHEKSWEKAKYWKRASVQHVKNDESISCH